MKRTVLFLCAANAVQGPMAEALLCRIDSEHFEAVSAGIEAGHLHTLTVEAMKEAGIQIERKSATSVRDVQSRNFDFVITLCDDARTYSSQFPGAERIHWNFEDPLTSGDFEKQRRAFRALRDQIAQRLHLFVLVQARSRPLTPAGRRDRQDLPSRL